MREGTAGDVCSPVGRRPNTAASLLAAFPVGFQWDACRGRCTERGAGIVSRLTARSTNWRGSPMLRSRKTHTTGGKGNGMRVILKGVHRVRMKLRDGRVATYYY